LVDEYFNSIECFNTDSENMKIDESLPYQNITLCMVLVAPKTINNICPMCVFTALLNSGSDETWFCKKALPLGCETCKIPLICRDTLAGMLEASEAVFVNHTILPEFFSLHWIMQFPARVVENMNCCYDMIIKCDLLLDLWMHIDFTNNVTMTWKGLADCPMKSKSNLQGLVKMDLHEALWHSLYLTTDAARDADLFATEIQDAKYDKADLAKVVAKCDHCWEHIQTLG
jgi:hypothetical protein